MAVATLLHEAGYENAPWYYQSGLSSIILIWFGALIFKMEKYLFFNLKPFWVFLFIFYLVMVYNVHSLTALERMSLNLQGLLLCLMSSLVLISFCSWLKPNTFVDRVGRSTIGLYFLSGAIPETASMIAKKFFELNDIVFVFVVIISFVVSVILNDLLRRYAGFLFDLRKIWNRNR